MTEVNIFNLFSSSWWKDYQDSKTQSEIKKRLSLAQVISYLLLATILSWRNLFEDLPSVLSTSLIVLSLIYAILYVWHYRNIQTSQEETTKTARIISFLNITFSLVGFIINIIILTIIIVLISKW